MLYSLATLLALSVVFASPTPAPGSPSPAYKPPKDACKPKCNISKVKLDLPACQTQLVEPTTPPKFITIGFGVQNYTCGASGTFGSVGAVAQLFDASCSASKGLTTLDRLPSLALKDAQAGRKEPTCLGKDPVKLGDHFFVTNPTTGSGIVPRFDFTASQKSAQAFFDGSKAGDIVSPTDPAEDVDWLMLNKLTGDLATQVFRVQTKGGQPPTSCTGSAATSIPYAAEYWFF